MTGLETVLITAGGVSVSTFATFLTTARYYQAKMESIQDQVMDSVTRSECKVCQEKKEKEDNKRQESTKEILACIHSLVTKYDRILKLLILNVEIPNELREQIMP